MGLAAVKASTALLCMSKDTDRRWRDTGGSWGDEGNMGGGEEMWGDTGMKGTWGHKWQECEGT